MMIIAQAYARRGHVQATVAALGDILHPRDICRRIDCLTVINKALIAADNSAGAEEVLTQIAKFGHDAQPYLDLLKMYSMKGDLINAIRMFDEILKNSDTPHPDAFVMLIELFGRRGDLANAQRVYSSMVNNAIEPNPKVIAALINAEVDADEGVSAARRFKKCSPETQTHPAVVAAVLRAFVKTKVPTDVALTVFRRCTKLDNRHWSMIILSACDSVQLDLARKLMYEMDIRSRTDVDSPAPDIYTFSTFMYGYLRVKEDGKARQVYDEMVRRKIVPTSVTYAMIVQSFLGDPRHGQSSLDQAHAFSMATLEKAKMGALPDTFKNKSETPHRLLSPLMVAAGRARQPEVAQNYFNLAVEDNQPTVPLLSSLMQAYRLAEDLPSVLDLWKEIFALARENLLSDDRDEGQTRSNELCVPLSIVLDALSAHGMYQEVKDTWKSVREAGFGFDATNYNSLAIALARTGDIEGACQVLNTIILPRWTKVQKVRRDLWNLQGQVKRMAQDRTNVKPRSPRTPRARNVLNEHPRDVIAALGPDSDDIFQSRLDSDSSSEVKATKREYSLPHRLEVEYAKGSIVSPVRTATRRAQNRQDIPESDRREMRGGLDHVISKLLAYWRPDDLHWKPTILLMDLFAHIFGQLERAEDAYRRGLRQQRQIAKWKVARTEAFRRAKGNKNRVPNYLRRQSPRHKVAKLPRKVRLEELVVQEKPTKVTYGESIRDRRKPSRRVPGTPNQRPESLDSRIRPQEPGVTLIAGFTDIPIRDVQGEAAVSTPTALLRRLMRKYPHAVEYIMVYRAVAAEKERLRKLDELKDLMIIERQILKRRRALVRACLLDLRSPEGIAAEHKSDIKAQRFRRDLIRLAKPPPIYLPAHIRQSHVSAERLEQAETFEIRGLFPVSQDPINIYQLKDEFLSQGGGWAWRQRLRELRRLRHERFRYKELQARKREAIREQRRLLRQKQLPRKVEHKRRSPIAKSRAQQEREKAAVAEKGGKEREPRRKGRRATVKTSAITPLRLAESKSPHRPEAKQGGSEEQRRSKLKTLAKVLDEANEKSFFDGFDHASTGVEGGGMEKKKKQKK
jgi:pentatricopeptide repeat protein